MLGCACKLLIDVLAFTKEYSLFTAQLVLSSVIYLILCFFDETETIITLVKRINEQTHWLS